MCRITPVSKLKKTGDTTAQSGYIDANGYFTLTAGQTITIDGIPYGTAYTITESASANYEQTSTSGDLSGNTDTTTRAGTVINTRRTGTLTLNKATVNTASRNNFDFEVTLNAPTGVDLTNYSITKDGTALTPQPTSGTAFTVNVPVSGGTGAVTLGGIPYGTTYTVTEASASKAGTTGVSGEVSTAQTIDGTDDSVTITNTYPAITDVTISKSGDGSNEANAEFELWYKETTTPATYSPNEPESVPDKKNSLKVPTNNSYAIPDPEVVITTITIPNTKYTYTPDGTPTASESEWILPRNDSDYIYFRDFNTGVLGLEDKESFDNGTGNSYKYSWRQVKFADQKASQVGDPGTHNQNEELDFADGSEWVAAQFSGTGKKTVEYAVWERFVDKYSGKTTVVWKIQPPDGYTYVRFMLYRGNQCVRTTDKIEYKLGKIYHKTGWGKYYRYENNQHCYFDVPTEEEPNYWAPYAGSVEDQRDSGSTMDQARKYIPTEDKIIFYCNSEKVWHNIHIEFFKKEGSSTNYDCAQTETINEEEQIVYYKRVNGQPFPGYMMEPYAYAESNYRLVHDNKEYYLTYELTIPEGATHFRINNGVDLSTIKGRFDANSSGQSPYAYRTEIKEIVSRGGKNNGNYFVLNSNADSTTNCSNTAAVTLIETKNTITSWIKKPEDEMSSSGEVESDYDYIYFEHPGTNSGWSNHIYAYFYGGGNLRDDNWQRACYSAWPGVAAVGTEYVDGSTAYHSTTYSYSIVDTNTDGNEYNATGTASASNPDTTFNNGNVVYRFRIPKGDRKNYSKVVFNDGLASNGNGGGHETGVITYQPGYLYKQNGTGKKQYEKSPTKQYTYRMTGTDADYLYIKVNPSTDANWDDIHITFYDTNGNRILQGGDGYVMEYSENNGTYDFFRIPIPTNAAKFKLNNGINKDTNHTKSTTAFTDILRKSTGTEANTSIDYTTGALVYELSGTTVTRTGPTFVVDNSNPLQDTTITTQSSGFPATGNTRTDKLKIRDVAGWDVPIGKAKVKYFNASGALLGEYTFVKSVADGDGKVWYTVEIPDDARSFTMTYTRTVSGSDVTKTTIAYDIYQYSANGSGVTGNWTQDGMYYILLAESRYQLLEQEKVYMVPIQPVLVRTIIGEL